MLLRGPLWPLSCPLSCPLPPLPSMVDCVRLDCVHAVRDWFRRILRRDSDKKINVTAVEDPVLLGVLKGKKFIIPPANDMEARLRAINYALDDEFPLLDSPKSIPPTPSHQFAKSFAAVAASPAGVAGPSSAPELPLVLTKTAAVSASPADPESPLDREDCTRDPLIIKMYAMMSSWDDRVKKLENRDARSADEEVSSSPVCCS